MPHPIPEGLDGVKRMIEVARNHDQVALVGLMGLCGLRVSEALDCTVPDFDLHDMMLSVRGKGDKTRHVPVSSLAWATLADPIVAAMDRPDRHLVQYQDRSARKCITALGRKAGLSRSISSHDLRATFATEAYNHTKDQRVVQELMGHASGATTEIYIGVTTAKMKAAVEF
jgi:site-specific recombinase XerD